MALYVGACVRHEGGFQIVTESLPQAPAAYGDDLALLQGIMAANEARSLGYGGISKVRQAFGL
jgi:hypothetical protein